MEQTAGEPRLRAPSEGFGGHTPMLRRYLLTLGARADQVDDLVQEAFVVALQKQIEDRGRQAVAAWLRGAAKNVRLRQVRSSAKRREVELADEVWREECRERDDSELVDALRHCLRQLPARSRTLLEHAYGRGSGRAEIGHEFGMVANGVKTALRRLRATLKRCLERSTRSGA